MNFKRLKVLIVVFNIMGIISIGVSFNAYAQNRVVVVPLLGEEPTGDATEGDVLQGKTFSNANQTGLTGTRPIAPVAKTGVTLSFLTGDDGDLHKGVAWPNPRFTDNSNGTVTDNLTGLIWLKNANCPNILRLWATALADVTQLNTDGTMNSNNCGDTSSSGSHQADWRLPNVSELHSLVHFGFFGPALPNTAGTGQWSADDPFVGVQSLYYWSSTTYADYPDNAWFVLMSSGFVGNYNKTFNSYYVWPVRGGN